MSISAIINTGFVETAQLDIHELVRRLNTHLGPTLVAAISGSKDTKQPIRWAKPDGPAPSPVFETRLRLAHRVWGYLADAESDHVARAWFIGGNPWLDEDTPMTAIREDRHKQVVAAVTAFLQDTYDA